MNKLYPVTNSEYEYVYVNLDTHICVIMS